MIFTLNGLHDSVVATIAVTTAVTSAPTTGYLTIESEIIYYASKGTNSFTTCTRGMFGTTAASHATATKLSVPVLIDSTGYPQIKLPAPIPFCIVKPFIVVPTTTINIYGIVTGSEWAVIDLDNNRAVKAIGNATGTTATATYENFKPFNAVVNIRKLGYVPAEYPLYISSGLTTIYVSQKIDPIA